MTDFKKERACLISMLRRKGIDDENVLEAINQVPRELFLDESLAGRAYEDNALPIEHGQTISQPYTVAYMTGKLETGKGHKVLEIGTGSGYQTCILYAMGCDVFTVERIPELQENAKVFFERFGFDIKTMIGDGSKGWKEYAPYDRIIVTAAAPSAPKSLLKQLKTGGRMVIPIGSRLYQTMTVFTKTNDGEFAKERFDDFKFVPLIGNEGWNY